MRAVKFKMNMQKGKTLKVNLKTLRVLPLAAMFILPLSGFAQNEKKEAANSERAELNYKQRHSKVSADNNLYADGIKIKRDLSILKEVQEERILSADEIPAEELYGGIWNNRYVKAYTGLENTPDTFKVDLSNFTMPCPGRITSYFGKRSRRRMHYGIDLSLSVGDTIYASFDGKVRVKQYERRGYGYYLVLRHTNGLESVYGHLSKFLVNEDEPVKSGDPIALGGNTGRSTGPHLHLEYRFLGNPINPMDLIDFNNKVCHTDSYTVTPRTFNYAGLSSKSPVRSGSYASSSATRSKTSVTNKYASGSIKYHKIQRGDTLSKIAKRHGTTVSKICKLNSITTKTTLRAGKSLRIS